MSSSNICQPIYDFCFIDGSKNWTIDSSAFFLVDKLLKQMHEKFEDMSTSVNQRLDNLGGKIDEIEKSITDLINEIGNEEVEI